MYPTPARTYLTVNDALPDLARHVLDGDELGSRKGERVLERLHEQITLTEPWDRYPRLSLRKASLPAQIAETMWILAGRNDVEWLAYYLPRAPEFSDDGETWRGGYGPRLRHYGADDYLARGIDQLDFIVRELKANPTSRRAVLSIYDPSIDTRKPDQDAAKDVPCNDFISFQSRLGKLHAHVFVRSNDLVWGWSGINAFEWSVLQEVVAGILGVGVGSLTFSISSLHSYDRHWSKLQRIAEAYPAPEEHMDPLNAFDAPRLSTDPHRPRTVAELDEEIAEWFEAEARIREAKTFDEAWTAAGSAACSALFDSFLQVIAAARFGCADDLPSRVLRESLKASPKPPFAVAEETEGWARPEGYAGGGLIKPSPPLAAASTSEELAARIEALHDTKHAAYGDSWKRRGETLGILANIARKVDRLGKTDDTETALDTAVDLLVYLAKYVVWLDDQATEEDRSDGTASANSITRNALRRAHADGRPYPAKYLARDLNDSVLAPEWTTPGQRAERAALVEIMTGRAARHVLGIWREGK